MIRFSHADCVKPEFHGSGEPAATMFFAYNVLRWLAERPPFDGSLPEMLPPPRMPCRINTLQHEWKLTIWQFVPDKHRRYRSNDLVGGRSGHSAGRIGLTLPSPLPLRSDFWSISSVQSGSLRWHHKPDQRFAVESHALLKVTGFQPAVLAATEFASACMLHDADCTWCDEVIKWHQHRRFISCMAKHQIPGHPRA